MTEQATQARTPSSAGQMTEFVSSPGFKRSIEWMKGAIEEAKVDALKVLKGTTVAEAGEELELAVHRYQHFEEFVEMYESFILIEKQE